jgi:hypothetical protein
MKTYRIQAHLGRRSSRAIYFEAEDDAKAILSGAVIVMENSRHEIWSRGQIVLRSDNGSIIQTMEAQS